MFDQQGVWVLPSSNAFGYPNAMLANRATLWQGSFDGWIFSITPFKHVRTQVL